MKPEPDGKMLVFDCGHCWIIKSDKPLTPMIYMGWLIMANQEHNQLHKEMDNK